MPQKFGRFRFLLPALCVCAFSAYVAYQLVRVYFESDVSEPVYSFEKKLKAPRGTIYARRMGQVDTVLAKSVPVWEYRLDPVALTNRVVRRKGKPPKTREEIVQTIASALKLPVDKVWKMSEKTANRYQFLALSSDLAAHDLLANSREVAGVVIIDAHVRDYPQGRRLSHVIGSINKENVGSAGIELLQNRELRGVEGIVSGALDVHRHELYDRRNVMVAPVPGADVYLTVDNNLQYEVEDALKWGLKEYGAASGWAIVMDPRTGEVLAMASLPDFHPNFYGRTHDRERLNRAIGFVYEPGSVMKTVTAAAGLDLGVIRPDSLYNTDRYEEGYYKLPGDGSHRWEPRMTIADAIAHSSNIVIGKLAYDLGPKRVSHYLRLFGFGAKTGIDLPGEEVGIIRSWDKWDKATQSRAGIGHGIGVTALQIANAYQAIANDGVRMRPYIIDHIVGHDGEILQKARPKVASRPISPKTSRQIRQMMLSVASRQGTARRAAIRGYSIAGKTGTAQKRVPGIRGYAPGLYCATFCGIVPSGVVKRNPTDPDPVPPRFVILVSLDFDQRTRYHQGGNSAGPVFRRIAIQALRYMGVEADRPDELDEYNDDEFDQLMDNRTYEADDAVDIDQNN